MKWTDEQKQVIDARGNNLLVAAGAGSGKTAVLVERILERVTDPKDPMSLDELLIVTFTDAAAAEMKERILKALEDRITADPGQVRLRRQAALVQSAQISTIHSFCLGVIRSHFQTIDLDPSFRIADEGELAILGSDVLDEILEERYQAAEESFLNCVNCLETGRRDGKIPDAVKRLYALAMSHAEPEEFYEQCLKLQDLSEIADYLRNVLKTLNLSPELAPQAYRDLFVSEEQALRELAELPDEELFASIGKINFRTLPRCSEPGKEAAQARRKKVKETLRKLEAEYAYAPVEVLRKDLETGRRVIAVLVDITREYAERFEKKRREKNLISYSDMEHLAYRILKQDAVAAEYRRQFREVMTDEYQDSSFIQEEILGRISTDRDRFMVGDVKQSIYSFRMASPELFTDKYYRYPEEPLSQRIDLHRNFRSRAQVLSAVNAIFTQIMRSEVGGVEYDDAQALVFGAAYDCAEDPSTEVLLCDVSKESMEDTDDSSRQIEARMIAARIRALLDELWVTDKETGQMRSVCYGDIAVLNRKGRGWSEVLAAELTRCGIPAVAESRNGYFDAVEVQTVLNYLRVLDNPYQDIPLAAVLRSPIAGVTSEELAAIRIDTPEGTFSEAVMACKTEKIVRFLKMAEQHRKRMLYTPLHQLIREVLNETGYGVYLEALSEGVKRRANIEILIQKAREYARTSYKGVFHFLRYIDGLRGQDLDYGEANVVDDTNSVKVMTIHKSKGLEFPVVFVSGLGNQLGKARNTDLIMSPKYGAAVYAVDPKRRIKTSTVARNYLQAMCRQDEIGEEIRILYVALTRAKEKLILTGCSKNPEGDEGKWTEVERQLIAGSDPAKGRTRLSVRSIAGAVTALDLIMPAVYGAEWAPAADACKKDALFEVKWVSPADLQDAELLDAVRNRIDRQSIEQISPGAVYDPKLHASLQAFSAYAYPFAEDTLRPVKRSVSELKLEAMEWEEDAHVEEAFEPEIPVPLIPAFLENEERISGTSRGTAYHRFLELYDYRKSVREALADMPEEVRKLLREKPLEAFVQSSLGREMKKAALSGCLVREQIFMIGVPVEDDPSEFSVVQGVIDAYYETEDGLVLVDYKTDRVQSKEELLLRYRTQLDWYARALEQLTTKRVAKKLIYSFSLGCTIEVS